MIRRDRDHALDRHAVTDKPTFQAAAVSAARKQGRSGSRGRVARRPDGRIPAARDDDVWSREPNVHGVRRYRARATELSGGGGQH